MNARCPFCGSQVVDVQALVCMTCGTTLTEREHFVRAVRGTKHRRVTDIILADTNNTRRRRKYRRDNNNNNAHTTL